MLITRYVRPSQSTDPVPSTSASLTQEEDDAMSLVSACEYEGVMDEVNKLDGSVDIESVVQESSDSAVDSLLYGLG